MKKTSCLSKKMLMLGVIVCLSLSGQVATADFVFGEAVHMGPVINGDGKDSDPSISSDGLELYFESERSGGYGSKDIWVATRPTNDAEWESPINLGSNINSASHEGAPCLSSDGLSLYYFAYLFGSLDIWVTRRATGNDDWGIPVNITLTSDIGEQTPSISFDGLQLFFCDHSQLGSLPGGVGGVDIWTVARPTISDPWGLPMNLGQLVNSPYTDRSPSISADGLLLFLNSNRSGGLGASDLWVTRRTATDDAWNVPMNLGPIVNTSFGEGGPCVSADGRTLYFHSVRPGGHGEQDLWQAPVIPIVDLNADGFIDAADLCIIVDNWMTDNPLCDVGPMPWGDGIVDVEDLIVVAEHLFEEFPPGG